MRCYHKKNFGVYLFISGSTNLLKEFDSLDDALVYVLPWRGPERGNVHKRVSIYGPNGNLIEAIETS